MPGFLIWALAGAAILLLGIRAFFLKKPAGFWANAPTMKVKDVKGYNRATGTLLVVYGVIFILLGLPLLGDETLPLILLSMVGVMLLTIITMAVYSLGITKKYQEK